MTALLTCLAIAPSLAAHDTIPTEWCPKGTEPTIVGTFSFDEPTLHAERSLRLQAGSAVLGSDCNKHRTCGIIDDWYWANQTAHDACGARQRSTGIAVPPAMPIVTSPSSFNDNEDLNGNGISDHHEDYGFAQRLEGVCVICTPPPGSTPGESPSRSR